MTETSGRDCEERKGPMLASWKHVKHLFRADEFICTACGASSRKAYKSCPACGADMRGEQYDPAWVDELEELNDLLDDDC